MLIKKKKKLKFGSLKKKKKKSSLYNSVSDNEPSSSSSSGGGDWAVTDPRKFRELAQQAQTENRRAPEVWVRDGSSVLLRFLDEGPLACISVYKFRVNGRWAKFTKPADGDPDLFATSLGLRPSKIFIYRAIDISGYTNKQGKKLRNIPRFYVATVRQYEQLQQLSKEVELPLNKFDIKISRSGSGTNTTYLFIPKPPTVMAVEQKKAAAAFPDFHAYYAPIPLSQQKSIVASVGASTDPQEDED